MKQFTNWNEILDPILASKELLEMKEEIKRRRKSARVWPAPADTFRAFNECNFEKFHVIIIGQDPYPQSEVADGLAFSTRKKERPFSLDVIFKEIRRELYDYIPEKNMNQLFQSNDLTPWAKQGVLLLNSTLTVEEGKPGSHRDMWGPFLSKLIDTFNEWDRKILFLLWGKDAREYSLKIDTRFSVLEAVHPAAEAYNSNAKFSGCNHFIGIHNWYISNRLHTVKEIDCFPLINMEELTTFVKKEIKNNFYPKQQAREHFDSGEFEARVRDGMKIEMYESINWNT